MSESEKPTESWDRAGVGFGVSWAALLVAVGIGFAIAIGMDAAGVHGSRPLLGGVLPPLLMLALLVAAVASGRRHFRSGVLAGFGSMFALTLLLVAACFGTFALDGF